MDEGPCDCFSFRWLYCCCLFGSCGAKDDALMDNEIPAPQPDKRPTKWCVDDSATERVFICDDTRNKYVVSGLGGATVRAGPQLTSEVLRTLPRGTVVVVTQVRSRRAHISRPMDGWASLSTESGYPILAPIDRPTKYKVIFPDGIFVRSSPNIEKGLIVRIAPNGTILKATGKTEIFDAIERVEVEDGWVSMRLREENGSGAPLLMALD